MPDLLHISSASTSTAISRIACRLRDAHSGYQHPARSQRCSFPTNWYAHETLAEPRTTLRASCTATFPAHAHVNGDHGWACPTGMDVPRSIVGRCLSIQSAMAVRRSIARTWRGVFNRCLGRSISFFISWPRRASHTKHRPRNPFK